MPAELPEGAMFEHQGRSWLRRGEGAAAWWPEGYGPVTPLPAASVAVLTPLCLVEALRAGYRPGLEE